MFSCINVPNLDLLMRHDYFPKHMSGFCLYNIADGLHLSKRKFEGLLKLAYRAFFGLFRQWVEPLMLEPIVSSLTGSAQLDHF